MRNDSTPEPSSDDQAWTEAVEALIIPQATRTLRLGKTRPCDRCSGVATWKIVEYGSPTEFLCTDHGSEWFPELFPTANVDSCHFCGKTSHLTLCS